MQHKIRSYPKLHNAKSKESRYSPLTKRRHIGTFFICFVQFPIENRIIISSRSILTFSFAFDKL